MAVVTQLLLPRLAPYTPPPSNYTPTYSEPVPVQQTVPVRYSSGAKTPDDAYNEGYDDGYSEGHSQYEDEEESNEDE